MNHDLKSNSPERSTSGVPRRTVVKAAAWSVPVIASTVASPAFAASGCAPGSASFSVPSPTQASGGVQNWTVPTGVTSVSFAVAGGAGGGFDATPGGKGARTTGTLAVTPGDVLTIYVGQGGRGAEREDEGEAPAERSPGKSAAGPACRRCSH